MKKGITAILLMIVLSYSAFALVGHNPSEIFPGTFSGHFKFENVTIMNQGNSSVLTIENNITSPEVCISGDCRTAWPTSGGDSLWVNSSGNATFTTGNVGIGTDSPDYNLHINTTGSGIKFQVEGDSYSQQISMGLANTGGNSYYFMNFGEGHPYNKSLTIYDGTDHRMLINKDGNVGIGTTSPGEKLDVSGNINATGDICITGGNCLSSVSGGSATQSNWSVPYGSIMAFNGTSCPAGWIPADGTAGTPNMTGRVVVGSGTGTDVNGRSVTFNSGEMGGEYNHTLTEAELAFHTHETKHIIEWNTASPTHDLSVTMTNADSRVNVGLTSTSTGGDQPHNNLQPYTALIYCMKNTDEAGSYVGASPSFYAYKSSAQSVANGNWVEVTWDTERFDTHDYFDLSANSFTPTVPGKYLLTATLRYGSLSDGTYSDIRLLKNGVGIALGGRERLGSNGNSAVSVTAVVDSDGDDEFTIEAYNSDSTSKNVLEGINSYFSGSRIDGGNGLWTRESSGNISYSGGNVGIGTTSPGQPLHVQKSNDDIARFESTDNLADISIKDNGATAFLGVNGNSNLAWWGPSNTESGMVQNLSSGNVGIGTSSPDVKLDVVGGIRPYNSNPSVSCNSNTLGVIIYGPGDDHFYGCRNNGGSPAWARLD